MIKLKNKIAIGCLIQWYEIDLIPQYLKSVKQALDNIENKKNVTIELYFNRSQTLEKIDESQTNLSEIHEKYDKLLLDIFNYDEEMSSYVGCEFNLVLKSNDYSNVTYTIADYRRDFNDEYCEKVDVLMWGETDSLIPRQTFEILDNLHSQVKNDTPKYISFFSTCKMWDESWKELEHPDFTDKPFIDSDKEDKEHWWSLRYNMTIDEMNKINDKVEELDVRVANQYKFNGCGLVISSDVVKSGVNIPRSVFFVHEDTAFLNSMIKYFNGAIPQYIIKNVLLVHNRKHPLKRNYVLGEQNIDKANIGGKRLSHKWYEVANKMCEHNAYNLFNQSRVYTWKDVFNES
tara:strand:+ start:247 stop:1284 length:1038 start_codon:yes stop_codon:yes gene_type:complete